MKGHRELEERVREREREKEDENGWCLCPTTFNLMVDTIIEASFETCHK